MLKQMLNQLNNQPAKHSDIAPSVSYSLDEVYAEANHTTTEYRAKTNKVRGLPA